MTGIDPFQSAMFFEHLDEPDAVFEFRTFADKKALEDKSLVRQITGTFKHCCEELADLNRRGAGIFAVINAGGRTDAAISRLRSLFIDADDLPFRESYPLRPSIIVKRDDMHFHAYWCTLAGEDVGRFRDAQKQLARFYGSDPKVCNESRVMRLPGFAHNKGEPLPVTLWQTSGERYTIDDVLTAHTTVFEQEPDQAHIGQTAPRPFTGPVTPSSFWRWADKAASSIAPGARNDQAFKIAAKACARGLNPAEVEGFLLKFASRDFSPREIGSVVRSAYSKPRTEALV